MKRCVHKYNGNRIVRDRLAFDHGNQAGRRHHAPLELAVCPSVPLPTAILLFGKASRVDRGPVKSSVKAFPEKMATERVEWKGGRKRRLILEGKLSRQGTSPRRDT